MITLVTHDYSDIGQSVPFMLEKRSYCVFHTGSHSTFKAETNKHYYGPSYNPTQEVLIKWSESLIDNTGRSTSIMSWSLQARLNLQQLPGQVPSTDFIQHLRWCLVHLVKSLPQMRALNLKYGLLITQATALHEQKQPTNTTASV